MKSFVLLGVCLCACWTSVLSGSYEDESLRKAIKNGDYSEVQRLVIDVGANVNHHEPGQQNTPLHIVAQMGITNTSNVFYDIASFLIERGAKLEETDYQANTPLQIAAGGAENILALLINRRANVSTVDTFLQTPLHKAAKFGKPKNVKLLVDAKANIDAIDKEHITPLMVAATFDLKKIGESYPETVDTLLKLGANENILNNLDYTVWHIVADNGRMDIMNVLIQHGKNVDVTNGKNQTPLMFAIQNGNENIVSALIQHGANVNHTEKDTEGGKAPLYFAALYDKNAAIKFNMTKMLLDHKANVNAQNNVNQTALHVAVNKGDVAIAELLLLYKADPNMKDSMNTSPWDLAEKNHQDKIIELFNKSGIKKSGVDRIVSSLGVCIVALVVMKTVSSALQ